MAKRKRNYTAPGLAFKAKKYSMITKAHWIIKHGFLGLLRYRLQMSHERHHVEDCLEWTTKAFELVAKTITTDTSMLNLIVDSLVQKKMGLMEAAAKFNNLELLQLEAVKASKTLCKDPLIWPQLLEIALTHGSDRVAKHIIDKYTPYTKDKTFLEKAIASVNANTIMAVYDSNYAMLQNGITPFYKCLLTGSLPLIKKIIESDCKHIPFREAALTQYVQHLLSSAKLETLTWDHWDLIMYVNQHFKMLKINNDAMDRDWARGKVLKLLAPPPSDSPYREEILVLLALAQLAIDHKMDISLRLAGETIVAQQRVEFIDYLLTEVAFAQHDLWLAIVKLCSPTIIMQYSRLADNGQTYSTVSRQDSLDTLQFLRNTLNSNFDNTILRDEIKAGNTEAVRYLVDQCGPYPLGVILEYAVTYEQIDIFLEYFKKSPTMAVLRPNFIKNQLLFAKHFHLLAKVASPLDLGLLPYDSTFLQYIAIARCSASLDTLFKVNETVDLKEVFVFYSADMDWYRKVAATKRMKDDHGPYNNWNWVYAAKCGSIPMVRALEDIYGRQAFKSNISKLLEWAEKYHHTPLIKYLKENR
ncbi:hypothetical protein SAMD00019534_068440 [Acytostelium subglobosum LB1]|uniref:hypothetical protein n=1 Tax=Acytostelium subglobosum LB1 TaxID=1410327 RepID=UPI000644C977|nr:hypothetical protein SAMD00019534_068440 [Acytostelium subglobosum LB1]GAM23669.1 hypothetical protein SAMD00019534_068440 [Acytostelium subglobosum LB1]|eukprot:XP_012753410.1 hypothetical protein SAMD00019534_068440 [Acytostelium subglobosum LB1]